MRNPILQSGGLDVAIPSTTSGQKVAAISLIVLLIASLAVIKWRQKLWGLSDAEKQAREQARGQRLRQTPAMLQVKSEAVANATVDLYEELAALFDKSDPRDTHTTVRGAVSTAYRAISVAWAGRVESIPRLARRGLGLAVTVSVLGAIAVSTSTVVRILSANPDDPTLADILSRVTSGAQTAVDIAGAFPYAGTLWGLAFAYTILLAEMVYSHWYVVAVLLVTTSVSIILLDRRLEESPPPLIKYPSLGLSVGVVSLLLVWSVGTAISAAGGAIGFPAIGDGLGFLAALGVAGWILVKTLPVVIGRIRHDIGNLREDSRLTAAYLLIQRATSVLGVVGAVLIGLYMLVGVADGRFAEVSTAFLAAEAEVQATVGIVLLFVIGVGAYSVADSWTDVRAALHAAFAQKAVRVQIAKRALPGVLVIGAYAFLYAMTETIVLSFVLALLVGGFVSKGITFATQASYRADWRSIFRRVLRPSPSYIGYLAYELAVDGREFFLIEVNGKQLLSDDRNEVVSAAKEIGTALATSETPPATDEEWQAKFVLDSGIADPNDWEDKHIEKVREAVFDHLRENGPRVPRSTFDNTLDEFSEETRRTALAHDSIRPYINLGSEYVSLAKDPYVDKDQTEWPSFSQSSRV